MNDVTSKTYTVSVSGRTYWNIVLPALEQLDLPAPLVVRAGRGAQARFSGLTQEQAHRLGEFCQAAGHSWLLDGELGEGEHSAASSILARVFIRDGERVMAEVERQKSGALL